MPVIADESEVRTLDPNKLHDRSGFNDMVSKLDKAMDEVRTGQTVDEAKPDAAKAKADADAAAAAAAVAATTDKAKTEEKWVSPKANDWKKLKGERDEWQTKATTFDAELKAKNAEIEALKKQPQIDPKELEALRNERDGLLKNIETVALEHSPVFNRHFTKLFGDATAAAKEAAGAEYAEQVGHLLALPPSKHRKEQLAQIVGSLDNELDKTSLTIAIRDMDRARAEREETLAKSGENLKKLNEVQQAKEAETLRQNQVAAEEAINQVLKMADDFDAFKLLDGEENAEHNAEVVKRKEFLKNFFTRKLEKADYAITPIKAARADHLEQVNKRLEADLKAAQDTIAKLSAGNPELQGHGSPKGGDKAKGFIEVFQENWAGKPF